MQDTTWIAEILEDIQCFAKENDLPKTEIVIGLALFYLEEDVTQKNNFVRTAVEANVLNCFQPRCDNVLCRDNVIEFPKSKGHRCPKQSGSHFPN